MILQESAGRLSARNADGTFNVVLITEGEGSTGHYSAELMNEASAAAFENVGSHPNHPADPTKPEQRNPMGLIGRVTNVKPGQDNGRAALLGAFKPGYPEVAEYVEKFGDLLGVSIYAKATGERRIGSKLVVESFDGSWPYTSVDVVLAAGAGGRFTLARESLLAIESATGATSPSDSRSFSIVDLAAHASVAAPAAAPLVTDPAIAHSFAIHVSPLARF